MEMLQSNDFFLNFGPGPFVNEEKHASSFRQNSNILKQITIFVSALTMDLTV